MEENKNLQIRIHNWEYTQWFYRAIKLCIISVKIYAVIMLKVAFEIKSNIYFE